MATYSEERKWTVYLHINKINGKEYVGITSTKPEKRWGSNGFGYKGQPFYYAIQKYGWNNFEHKILKENLTEKEACDFEYNYIKENDLVKKGYNADFGGKLGKSRFGAENVNSRPVIFDGMEYDSVSTLCKTFNFTYEKITPYLRHEHKMPVEFYVLGLRYKDEDMNTYKLMDKRQIKNKEVILDNILFESSKSCSEYCGVDIIKLRGWLNGTTRMPREYYDRGLRYSYKEMKDYHHQEELIIKNNSKEITIDDKIFLSVAYCSEYLNVPRKNITNWLNGKTSMPKKYYNRGLRYVYLDNSKIICSKRNDSGFKKVRIDDIIFNTIKDISDYIKIEKTLVEDYLKGKVTMPKELYERGLRYVDESLNANIIPRNK